jgi:hypothetical protein
MVVATAQVVRPYWFMYDRWFGRELGGLRVVTPDLEYTTLMEDKHKCAWVWSRGSSPIEKLKKKNKLTTVEPGYNDIGLYDTSPITSDILWYQLIPHC